MADTRKRVFKSFDDLLTLFRDYGPTILASGAILAPTVWLILHFFYKERIEKLNEEISRLERILKDPTPWAASSQDAQPYKTSGDNTKSALLVSSLVGQARPVFRLRGIGFEGGDDAALETVIAAQDFAKKISADEDCFSVVLPEAEENEARISKLKGISDRNDGEKRELVARLGSSEENKRLYATLHGAFRIVLQDRTFRASAKLATFPKNTWEVLSACESSCFGTLSPGGQSVPGAGA